MAYGDESWELDALEPSLLNSVILDAVEPYLDRQRWDDATEVLERERENLRKIERNWAAVVEFVADLNED